MSNELVAFQKGCHSFYLSIWLNIFVYQSA